MNRSKKTVLFLDPAFSEARLASAGFSKSYHVLCPETGSGALREIEEGVVDIAIIEMRANPGDLGDNITHHGRYTGLELMKKIRDLERAGKPVPRIVVWAEHRDDSIQEEMEELGAIDYILKCDEELETVQILYLLTQTKAGQNGFPTRMTWHAICELIEDFFKTQHPLPRSEETIVKDYYGRLRDNPDKHHYKEYESRRDKLIEFMSVIDGISGKGMNLTELSQLGKMYREELRVFEKNPYVLLPLAKFNVLLSEAYLKIDLPFNQISRPIQMGRKASRLYHTMGNELRSAMVLLDVVVPAYERQGNHGLAKRCARDARKSFFAAGSPREVRAVNKLLYQLDLTLRLPDAKVRFLSE